MHLVLKAVLKTGFLAIRFVLSFTGAVEVIFYDGFKKIVQPINLRPMPSRVCIGVMVCLQIYTASRRNKVRI